MLSCASLHGAETPRVKKKPTSDILSCRNKSQTNMSVFEADQQGQTQDDLRRIYNKLQTVLLVTDF